MTNTTRFLTLWLLGAALLVPLHGLMPGIGSGLIAAAVGAAFLYAQRARQDRGLRAALVAVAVFSALLWIGSLSA